MFSTNQRVSTLFIFPTLALCLGILWQYLWPYESWVLFIGVLISVIPIFLPKIDFNVRVLGLSFVFFFAGCLVLLLQRNCRQQMLDRYTGQNVNVVGDIESILPQILGKNIYVIVLRVRHIKFLETLACEDVNFKLQMYVHKKYLPDLQVADKIEISELFIKRTKSVSLAGNSSFDDYLSKEEILASVFSYKPIEFKPLERPSFSLKRWISQKRLQIYYELAEKLSAKTFAYFSLIFLGNKIPQETDKLRQVFNYWGIAYYLARSGIHIVFFIMIWQLALGILPLHLSIRRFLLLLICIVYNFLSWSSIPFARSFYMLLLIESGKIFEQQINFMYLLSVTCAVILLFNPMQLFFLDFQLTFLLTFALSWVSQLIARDKAKEKALASNSMPRPS